MEGIAYRHDAVARAGRLVPDDRDLLEWARRLKQSKIVGCVAGNETQRHRGLSAQIASDVADATVNYMLVGDNVSVAADDETGAEFIDGLAGFRHRRTRLPRSGRSRRLCDRLQKRKLAGTGDPVFLDAGNAIDQRGKKLRRLGQVELK